MLSCKEKSARSSVLKWALISSITGALSMSAMASSRTVEGARRTTTVLNTFISDSIQIDQVTPGSLNPADANLHTGNDPADGTASYNVPAGGPGAYIDWHNLGGDLVNHRLLDLNDASGKDPSSFPGSNECVGPSQVLSKMDLTYVASANNNQFAYFAVQRSNNNGDAGYYWIFTKLAPHQNLGEAPCKPAQTRLLYDISAPSGGSTGDVLIAGHFHPNGTPLLRVFHAKKNVTNLSAVNAIDYTDTTLWEEDPNGVAAVAINTTRTAPGAFGAAGVLATTAGNLDPEIIAEAALPLSVFTGTSACGSTFYGSVITRSSGSGGTSPDLKDLAGPALFNFGGITASASLTPTCGLSAGYTASAIGANGLPVGSPQCAWTFDNGSTSSSCSGSQTLPAGSHTGTVIVTDPATGCTDTVQTAAVTLYPPLSVSALMTAGCTSSFSYDATVTGGSNPSGVAYAWSFSGGGTTTPSTSSTKSGSVAVGTGGVSYSGAVTVTDPRTDGLTCTANSSNTVTPYSPLGISLALIAQPLACPAMSSDAATYQATATGGSGSYSILWSDPFCTGTNCIINPGDSTFCYSQSLTATASDTNGVCPPVTSAPATYSKTTTVNASTLTTRMNSTKKKSRRSQSFFN